ncbi:hypothetical protein QVD17_31120 [Tagetes erecta]|uniref:Uncharacterized protein n=1 Tax=Tagetes erecta TaxID=13708 RepID=A0AAD8K3R6_TARER|nr:hypothetical protein QVD17_31113 [Tagetes erecta]KAK1415340.1 hypothetical protein QVD17_31120 [Tagetes erecta]
MHRRKGFQILNRFVSLIRSYGNGTKSGMRFPFCFERSLCVAGNETGLENGNGTKMVIEPIISQEKENQDNDKHALKPRLLVVSAEEIQFEVPAYDFKKT